MSAALQHIAIIIPALNEAEHIACALAAPGSADVIVADGGSTDDTAAIAARAGANVVTAEGGRGAQQNAGARAAGDAGILLFLHADTQLPENWTRHVRSLLADDGVALGSFRLAIAGAGLRGHLVAWGANMRSRWLGLPYGDQALFLRRETFEALGGFSALPIMEDFDLACRARRLGRVRIARAAVSTSPRRWQRLGYFRTTLVNQLMLAGWMLGISPRRLASIYRRTR